MEENKKETPVKQREEDEEEECVKSENLIAERFFKVMSPDFNTILVRSRLPPVFCKKLKATEIPENAVLISRKGRWNVKISGCCSMNGEEQVCFKEGWDKFAEAHEIGLKDFAVFEHKGNMHFNVLLYDSSTCCENYFSSYMKVDEDENDSSPVDEDENDSSSDIYERVSQKIKRGRPRNGGMNSHQKHQFAAKIYTAKTCMRIPRSFWEPNKLEGKKHILLSGPSGKLCEVNLSWVKDGQNLYTSGGWIEFCKSNGLKDGDICIFKVSGDPSTSSCPIKLNVQVIQAPK